MVDRDWCVMRQDALGNSAVADELTEPEARLLVVSYAARGHARYWLERMAPAPIAPEASRPIHLPTWINERLSDDDSDAGN